MAEPFIASLQYGDYKGTVAADTLDAPTLRELAKRTNMPPGYFPVGLHVWRLRPDDDGQIPFAVVAVDTRDTEHTLDGILKAAGTAEEVAVYPFNGKIAPLDLIAVFKRFDLKLVNKHLSKFNVVQYNQP